MDRITQIDFEISVAVASKIIFGLKVWGIMTIYMNYLTWRAFRVFYPLIEKGMITKATNHLIRFLFALQLPLFTP